MTVPRSAEMHYSPQEACCFRAQSWKSESAPMDGGAGSSADPNLKDEIITRDDGQKKFPEKMSMAKRGACSRQNRILSTMVSTGTKTHTTPDLLTISPQWWLKKFIFKKTHKETNAVWAIKWKLLRDIYVHRKKSRTTWTQDDTIMWTICAQNNSKKKSSTRTT